MNEPTADLSQRAQALLDQFVAERDPEARAFAWKAYIDALCDDILAIEAQCASKEEQSA